MNARIATVKVHSSDRQRWLTVLWVVRIFGPCRGSDVQRRTHLARHTIREALETLEKEGLVARDEDSRFDATQLGRDLLEQERQMFSRSEIRQPMLPLNGEG